MQGGWQPPPGGGGGGYGPPGGGGGGYGGPPPGGGGPPGYGGGPPQQQQGGYAPNPYAGAPPPQMGGMQQQFGNYEFNEYENSIIDKTAGRIKLWGIVSMVVGIMQVLGSCAMFADPRYADNLPYGIVAIVVGVTFMGAGNSLKAVVTTQGNDIANLMQAMQKMSSAFIIETIATIVMVIVKILIAVLVAFVFVAVAASQ